MLKNWNIWRIFRLIIGIAVLYEGGQDESIILYLLGSFLVAHAFLNIGCGGKACEGDQCSAPDSEEEDTV